MALFSLLKRPQSFHLQQDTDLPVNREGESPLSPQWDKRSAVLSLRNKRLATQKTQTITTRVVFKVCMSHVALLIFSLYSCMHINMPAGMTGVYSK